MGSKAWENVEVDVQVEPAAIGVGCLYPDGVALHSDAAGGRTLARLGDVDVDAPEEGERGVGEGGAGHGGIEGRALCRGEIRNSAPRCAKGKLMN